MDKRQIFKRNLPIYMEKAGMKQVDLAKALNMSKSTVHCWMTGKAFPEIDTIQKIADALGCQTDDLIIDRKDKVSALIEFINPSQSLELGLDLPALKRLKSEAPKEDARMTVLWNSASLQAKQATIAFLEYYKKEETLK